MGVEVDVVGVEGIGRSKEESGGGDGKRGVLKKVFAVEVKVETQENMEIEGSQWRWRWKPIWKSRWKWRRR